MVTNLRCKLSIFSGITFSENMVTRLGQRGSPTVMMLKRMCLVDVDGVAVAVARGSWDVFKSSLDAFRGGRRRCCSAEGLCLGSFP